MTKRNHQCPRPVFSLCILSLLPVVSLFAHADATFHADRDAFMAAIDSSVTDGYTAYAPGQYTNSAMTAVFEEARYESVSFPDLNSVGDVFIRGDGSNYCAGCNGNFKLYFDATSYSINGSVFGVGMDIVLHTSRRVSIGDDDPNNPTYEGGVEIQYADGSTQQIWIPPDIGYYEPSVYFLGITDTRGISSISIGTEPISGRHSWVIDNLTVASPQFIEVPIDIAFCSDPNNFNCRSNELLPVTIFGTDSVGVADIDVTTLRLCNEDLSLCTSSPLEWSYNDSGDPTTDLGVSQCGSNKKKRNNSGANSPNEDGLVDLKAMFDPLDVQDILVGFCSSAKGEVSEPLSIIGATYDGRMIRSQPIPSLGIDQLLKVNK